MESPEDCERPLGSIEQERVRGRVSAKTRARTHQALLILLLQGTIAQALAVVTLALHLFALLGQFARQPVAIVKQTLRAASKSVPGLPGWACVTSNRTGTAAAA